MPKKSGAKSSRARVSRTSRPVARPASVLPVDSTVVPTSPIARPIGSASTPATAAPPRSTSRSYRPPRIGGLIPITDYSYVMTDLRRIGVLAGIAFLVLFALTFVIH